MPSDCLFFSAYHGLVVEGEALQLPQCVGGSGELFEDDEGLSPHPHCLHGYDVDNLTKLREERVQRTLQLCKRKTESIANSPLHDVSTSRSNCSEI